MNYERVGVAKYGDSILVVRSYLIATSTYLSEAFEAVIERTFREKEIRI